MWKGLQRAGRRLARRPTFTISATALIGGTLGILLTVGSAATAVLWEALPHPDEERLVYLYWSRAELAIPDMALSLVTARELLERSSAFDLIGVTRAPVNVTLESIDGPQRMTAGIVTPETFELLGVEPVAGRPFAREEGRAGTASRAVVLSHRAWRRLFGEDVGLVGRDIRLNGESRTVVGILPPDRSLAPEEPVSVDVWFPMGAAEQVLGQPAFTSPGYRVFRATARLRPGLGYEGLQVELDRIAAGLATDYPATVGGWTLNADTLRERVVGRIDQPLMALLVGSALLLAVGVVNLSGLFLQRAEEEAGEFATRWMLGATARDVGLVRGLDALGVGLASGALTTVVAAAGLAALDAGHVLELPAHVRLGLSAAHVGIAFVVSVIVSLVAVFGAGRVLLSRTVGRVGGIDLRASRRTSRVGRFGLALQVALTTCLVIGAASTLRSLSALRSVDTGMRVEGLTTAHLDLPAEMMGAPELARAGREVLEGLNSLPEIDDAFLWSPMVPSDARTFTRLVLERMPEGSTDEFVVARFHSVSAGAITALGLTLREGRDMTAADRDAERRVALVSATAARRWWGDEHAGVGQSLRRSTHREWSEVVGVVADASFSGRLGPGSDNFMDVFFMYDQEPRVTPVIFVSGQRPVGTQTIAEVVHRSLPRAPVFDVRPLASRLREQEQVHRSTAVLVGLYSAAALLIAAVGLVGSTMLLMNRKRLEIGIRQALGAQRTTVLRQLGGGALATITAGAAAGALLTRWALGFIDPEILSVGPADPWSYAIGTTLLVACGTGAVFVPTWLQLRSEPHEQLDAAARE